MLPGLVDAVAHNRRHGRRDVRLFELGTRFVRGSGESRTLSLGLVWRGHGGTLERTGAAGRPVRSPRRRRWAGARHGADPAGAGRGAAVVDAGRARPRSTPSTAAESRALLGVVGRVQTSLTTARDIPAQDDVLVAELDLDAVVALVTMLDVARAHPLPRFPSIVRDLSILVDESLLAADVRGTIQAVAPATLVRVAEFDRYQGKGIAEGKVSVSYRLTFQAPDRTLTDAEADAAMATIVDALTRAHGAVRR